MCCMIKIQSRLILQHVVHVIALGLKKKDNYRDTLIFVTCHSILTHFSSIAKCGIDFC